MIREANKYDLPALVDMMRLYAAEGPIEPLRHAAVHNSAHVESMMMQIMFGCGFILVDNELRGMIIALRQPNVWCPGVYELTEMAWYVKSEHRNGTVGGRLWKEFDNRAKAMLDDGRVGFVCTSIMATSPFIDYTKRGYSPLEATFFRTA